MEKDLKKLDDKFDTTPDGLEGTGASLNAEIAHFWVVDNLYLAFDLPPAALMVLPSLAFEPPVVFVMVDQR